MIEIKVDKNGKYKPEVIEYLKGQYSFRERIKRRGIGSPKVVYESGIKEFDSLNRGLVSETAFASFELQNNGLIVRMNINQRLSCIGIRTEEIEQINLVAYRVNIRQKIALRRKIKTIHRGELEIILINETLKFAVRELEFRDILKYFSEADFNEIFRYSICLNFPE